MTARRQFLKTLGAAGAAALVPAGSARALAATDNQRGAVKDILSYVSIKDVEVFRLKFDKKTPLTWNAIKKSGGTYPSATYLKITTDQGIVGYAGTKGSARDVASFANKIKGLNLLNTEQVWDHMFFHNRKPVAKGKEIHAIGSVDLAVWDIVGKALNQPVHRILGTYTEQIPVYAAGGYYADGKGIRDLVKEMEDYIDEGYDTVKMKVGYLTPRRDAERVRAVRKALGPDTKIMIDANNGYKSAYEAIRFGRMVEDLDLYWFEEPVMPYDWRGNHEVKDQLDIPIVAGENEYTRFGALDLLSNDACDIINMDTIKAGGITEMRKIAALCSAHHVPVAPHGFAHMNVHVVASLSNALILETYPKKARDFNPALPAFAVTKGKIQAPQAVGLGMEPAADLIKKYKV
ncbi:mandelate racemase/muconate lactonizing enzyme family protein [Exilibacterium tricleocarpae]|uniref:Mandelate racemase/muconate lactonizing enzyme family protein n=1 Tax=Exilibacterium tricleocarpae TaxID=2591008 RepID=A0A545T5T1_9GAMM|nr:mandelate racemase/muconate lactonizing enzyme family protein [Exilibacterium tricleocarpae]TQV72596.1 mandelate racemase/muconate lactonizing enzyme family protein [Exilibacterium tricleocarpae]